MGFELNKIYNESNLETMSRMPDNFIDLTVTSPPYDNLRTYKGYSFPFEDIARELYRVTKVGGVVVWVVGDATVNGSETGTSFKQALFFKECGFNLHDTMIWNKISPVPNDTRQNRYVNGFEYMFIFSKGKPNMCNYIRSKSKQAGNIRSGKQRKINGDRRIDFSKKSIVNNNKVVSNVWSIHRDYGISWHPAIFPEKLAADHIYSWSNEGDIVYDCFGGSGTTAKMAHLMKRKWILSEISLEYCELAQKRIAPYLAQTSLF